ncbi:unnamed protein product [Clonostachys chloroleuca]|uniref:(S)-ureidoglycine aminohydrolase cupin domain-containing protein n=1 Tax=Clonostachys chloroleuca TaxID=1926264 RepID=A0AA35MJK4_9HYPO|nr:unnamed protein product [Clonostachys chloroleuca]
MARAHSKYRRSGDRTHSSVIFTAHDRGSCKDTRQSDGENLSCGFFHMTRGEPLTSIYPYNEALVVLDGTFELVDGVGNKSSAKKGDVYFFSENSMVTFSTSDEGLAFYTVQRKKK